MHDGLDVIIVDDDPGVCQVISEIIKSFYVWGDVFTFTDVDDASDGTEALEKLREKRYGLVISDWNMEPMTGYELLKEVRADEELNRTPFIMITAESNTENVIAAKKAGVSNYIVEPSNAGTLKAKIAAVFGE